MKHQKTDSTKFFITQEMEKKFSGKTVYVDILGVVFTVQQMREVSPRKFNVQLHTGSWMAGAVEANRLFLAR